MGMPLVVRTGSNLFPDRRDEGRALRVTWHPLDEMFVMSTWRGGQCASTFQLTRSEVPDLIAALARGLAETPAGWSPPSYQALRAEPGRFGAARRLARWATKRR